MGKSRGEKGPRREHRKKGHKKRRAKKKRKEERVMIGDLYVARVQAARHQYREVSGHLCSSRKSKQETVDRNLRNTNSSCEAAGKKYHEALYYRLGNVPVERLPRPTSSHAGLGVFVGFHFGVEENGVGQARERLALEAHLIRRRA
jgi:hypothetical protein